MVIAALVPPVSLIWAYAQRGRAITWTRSFWFEMRASANDRVYLNFPGKGEEGEARLKSTYGEMNYKL